MKSCIEFDHDVKVEAQSVLVLLVPVVMAFLFSSKLAPLIKQIFSENSLPLAVFVIVVPSLIIYLVSIYIDCCVEKEYKKPDLRSPYNPFNAYA